MIPPRLLDAILRWLHFDVSLTWCDGSEKYDLAIERPVFGYATSLAIAPPELADVALSLAAVTNEVMPVELRIEQGAMAKVLEIPAWALPKARRLLAVEARSGQLRRDAEEHRRLALERARERGDLDEPLELPPPRMRTR